MGICAQKGGIQRRRLNSRLFWAGWPGRVPLFFGTPPPPPLPMHKTARRVTVMMWHIVFAVKTDRFSAKKL